MVKSISCCNIAKEGFSDNNTHRQFVDYYNARNTPEVCQTVIDTVYIIVIAERVICINIIICIDVRLLLPNNCIYKDKIKLYFYYPLSHLYP